jgi:putative redox protein
MRINLKGLSISAQGELTETHPKIYKRIHIVIKARIETKNQDKFKKAVELGWEHYCGVIAMIKKFATVSYEIEFTGQQHI